MSAKWKKSRLAKRNVAKLASSFKVERREKDDVDGYSVAKSKYKLNTHSDIAFQIDMLKMLRMHGTCHVDAVITY